ncbi:MAG: polypeptide-transport-associated domain-containing protein [Gallionellaceae bacterium]|nr:MAG: polypeptide-transport-associated domain-containing protein [Gallionellaceae bacterium]
MILTPPTKKCWPSLNPTSPHRCQPACGSWVSALPLLLALCAATPPALAQNGAIANAEPVILRFEIARYLVEGATLLTTEEISSAVAPYTGKSKDFSDVQRALEAVENLYARHGYSAVRVSLPEQELELGTVRLRVVESRFGKVAVKNNQHFSVANALRALPSINPGDIPGSKRIARELRLANENPARQMNVVLKAGEKDDEVDANVIVTDSAPGAWTLSADNTGSTETGRTRLGLAYRHANLFDRDHVGSAQFQTSPQYPNRVTVLGGSYKIPLYGMGDSVEFFGGYSNVNSVVGGLSNFQGGGTLFSARYNRPLDRIGSFEPRLSLGLDWRDFKRIEQTSPPPAVVIYNEIVAMPASLALSAQGKFARSDLGLNAALSANIPGANKGGTADFAAYDPLGALRPDAHYRVLRYGANYAQQIAESWQVRALLTGQWSRNILLLGEQFRLGGADGVRGFSEGAESGERGLRWSVEGYTPELGSVENSVRALAFFDAGQAMSRGQDKSFISSSGFGLRANFGGTWALRMDVAWIINAGADPLQQVGDWRGHVALSAGF